MSTRITIDPITRIEGHLRIDVEMDNGRVSKAWSSGQMWRGIEQIVVGRDPRDAWTIVQRICGVCTTVHAMASVRSVESALKLEIPVNAHYIRNMILAAHSLQDHIVHFYHLSALDWVDVVSALKADPVKAAQMAESLSEWTGNSRHAMTDVQKRLQTFVDAGQMGVFTNGYWGHPAMKLPPEVNLMAVAHYLQALEVQRQASKIVATLGSKSPHIQNLAVGGVANPLSLDSQSVLTIERLMLIKEMIDKLGAFIRNCYQVDVAAIGAFYRDWTAIGRGVVDYLAAPEAPMDGKCSQFMIPGGSITDGDLSTYKPIASHDDAYFRDGVAESVKHAWYSYKDDAGPLHPWKGETTPNYTDFQDDGKYSWVKSPTFYGKAVQVGPLASVLCGVAAGHQPTITQLDGILATMGSLSGSKVPMSALHSTIGRHVARAARAGVMYEVLRANWQALMDNMAKGDMTTFNKPEFPKGEIMGVGVHEAPRGLLSHWSVIKDGKLTNYQAVVPTTWLAAPKGENGQVAPYEASLIGTPVADPERPLEVLRTVHSFDPCLACAVHLTDLAGKTSVQVTAA